MTSDRKPTTDEPSFDPKTWSGRPAAASSAPQPAPGAGLTSRRNLILGGGGTLMVAGVGAAVILGRRKPESAPAKAKAPAGPATAERRKLTLGRGESAVGALQQLGVRPADLTEIDRLAPGLVGPGPLDLTAERRAEGLLVQALAVRISDGQTFSFARPNAGAPLALTRSAAAQESNIVVVHGEVDDVSFYSSAVRAGMNDAVTPQFTRALAFDLDFAREVAPGDAFEAVYEEPTGGERRLLFVGFRHAARRKADGATDRAVIIERYFFAPEGGKADWYDARGGGARRALMRTPLDGARVTSVFGPRKHPVLGYTRTHQGVDFGAAIGTPVFASGDGTVEFAGVARGYGNYLKIRHSEQLVTAYAHLDTFGEGIAPGAAVRQGEVVARSGQTGIGTGPHLHYEVIVDGAHTDPLTALSSLGEGPAELLKGPVLKAFHLERDRIDALRSTGL